MQKLSKEEADQIIPAGKGRNTLVGGAVKNLAVGEGLIITRKDWFTKSPPYTAINYVARTTGRTFRKGRMPDGSGWFVQRVS